jgi:hypothetical protein
MLSPLLHASSGAAPNLPMNKVASFFLRENAWILMSDDYKNRSSGSVPRQCYLANQRMGVWPPSKGAPTRRRARPA